MINFTKSNISRISFGTNIPVNNLTIANANTTQHQSAITLGAKNPNPFNPTTTIKYSIPELLHIKLKIFDVLGREIATLVNEEKQPGVYTVNWNANSLTNGVYFYRLEAGSFIEVKKLLLLK